jgi:hypothetical protein
VERRLHRLTIISLYRLVYLPEQRSFFSSVISPLVSECRSQRMSDGQTRPFCYTSCVEVSLSVPETDGCAERWDKEPQQHREGRNMASKELEITTNTYIFAGVGAVIIGSLAAFALGGIPNTIAAAVVGGLAGGCLGLFF